MKKKTLDIVKICLAIILFLFSLYGFYRNSDIVPKDKKDDVDTADINQYTKSDYFLRTEEPLVAFVGDKSKEDKAVSKQTQKLCDYTKLPFSIISNKVFNKNNYQLPKSLKTLVINKTDSISNKGFERLVSFVSNGGGLIITNISTDSRLNYLIGRQLEESLRTYNTSAKGFYFDNDFMPNLNGVSLFKEHKHFGFAKTSFTSKIKTLLSACNENDYPVILENKIEQGNVIYFNTSLSFSKYERGMLFPCILRTLRGIPYPVANVNTIFLDDFPSPVYPFVKEPVRSEYNVSSEQFVRKIWWPDMLRLAKKHNIKYTAGIIFDYDENVEPPFSYKQWNRSENDKPSISHQITQSVLKNKHELGLHGYNHVSLQLKDWKVENMKIALNSVKKIWRVSGFGKLPSSYIPPTNYIDKHGILTLNSTIPSIKYMCSLYTGSFEKGGDREYDPEPYTDKMFDLPRNTSGFYLNDLKKFLKESTFMFTGIWSHFIHPDDIYQIASNKDKTSGHFSSRNEIGLNWWKKNDKDYKGMYFTFDEMLTKHTTNYPYTTFPRVRGAARKIISIRQSDFVHKKTKDSYVITTKNSPKNINNWFVYVDKTSSEKLFRNLKSQNIRFSKTPLMDGFLVNAITKKSEIKVPLFLLGDSETDGVSRYHKYMSDNQRTKQFDQGEYVPTDQLKTARDNIINTNNTDTESWDDYIKFSTWEEKQQQLWDDLESVYQAKPTYEVALLSDKVAEKAWYPTPKLREIWLERKIKTATDEQIKIGLLKQYVSDYNTRSNASAIREKLKEISILEPTDENKIAYVESYLWGDPEAKYNFLDKLEPEPVYKSLAKDIAWYFYKEKNIDKALAWARLTDEIPIETQMYWLHKNKPYDDLEEFYKNYDYKSDSQKSTATDAMIDYNLALDKFDKAVEIASTIPEGASNFKKNKKRLNKSYLGQKDKVLKEHLDNPYLDKKNRDSISSSIMLKEGSYTNLETSISTFKEELQTLDNILTRSFVSKKKNSHNISLIRSLINPVINKEDGSEVVYGIDYEFKRSRLANKKINYKAKFGVQTNFNKYNPYTELGGSYNGQGILIALESNVRPVKNHYGITNSFYNYKNSLYLEKSFKNNMIAYLSYENNFYTDSNTDNTLSGTFAYPLIKKNNGFIRAITQTTFSLGSTDLEGLPYWMIRRRFFTGLGLQYQLNTDIDRLFINTDGMYFYDTYSDSFGRLRAKVNYRFYKNFSGSFSGEFHMNNKFYSNTFNFGIRYYH